MKDPRAIKKFIMEEVSLFDLLLDHGTEISQNQYEEQISCPFHGKDVKKSARHYPQTNTMYCFTCKKAWDPLSFWMESQSVRFMEAARQLSAMYHLDFSSIQDIQGASKLSLSGQEGHKLDKRKMALYVLEQRVKAVLPIEDPEVAAKLLYILSSARHIEDPAQFAKITTPLAKRLNHILK
jgi:hypothetical protein